MIFTLDTETRGLYGDIFKLGLYNGKDYFDAYQFNEIKKILIDYSLAYDVHVYIHNLDFDLSKIVKELEGEIIFKDSLFINNRATTVKTKHFTLHDSYSLLTGSLEKLCQDFNIEEGKLDFIEELIQKKETRYFVYDRYERKMIETKTGEFESKFVRIEPPRLNIRESKGNFFMYVEPDDELLNRYLKMDCIGLFKLLELTIKISGIPKEDFIKCPTTASLSMKVFKMQYDAEYKQSISTSYKGQGRIDELFLRGGYYGGRTEVFIPVMNKGYHYDVNSLYPYVMKENHFPVGYYERFIGKEGQQIFQYWRKRKKGAGFIYAKVDIPKMNIPPLPKRDEIRGKLIFPIGMVEGTWTFEELEMALEFGVKLIEVVEVMYYKQTANIFQSFVSYFEKIKNESTGAKRQFAKLMLNSLYGKFGTQRERDTYTDYSEEELLSIQKSLLERKKIMKHIKTDVRKMKFHKINQEVIRYVKELESPYIQVQLSAYVTSYARILLYRTMKEIERKGGKIAYCDTDSIVSDIPLPDDLVHEKEFGKWQLEKKIDIGYFIQPKLYYEEYEKNGERKETKKGKGIPKSELNKWNKAYYQYVLESIIEEKESIPIFNDLESRQKVISALKSNKDFEEILQLTKVINLQSEQKRKVDYVGNKSEPHTVYDFGSKYVENQQPSYLERLRKENLRVANETDFFELRQAIQENGKIRVILKGDKYFREYQQMSRSTKVKYFSALGIEIEEFCSYANIEPNELVEQLRSM